MRGWKEIPRLAEFGLGLLEPRVDQALPPAEYFVVARAVTGHATNFACFSHCASQPFLGQEVAALAADADLIHLARHRIQSLAARSGIQILCGGVAVTMACAAGVRSRGSRCELATRCVLNLEMAVRAINLVIGHVRFMQNSGLAVALKEHRIVVAGVAPLARNLAGSLHHVRVARSALHIETIYLAMVEAEVGLCQHLVGNLMAKRAPRFPLIEGLALEMTDEAVLLIDSYVAAHGHMWIGRRRGSIARGHRSKGSSRGVTRRAPELLAAAHLGHVWSMIELDLVECLLSWQQPSFVTVQASRLIDVGPRLGAIGSGEITRDHRESFVLLAQLGRNPRWYVAFDASDLAVGGGLPGLEVRLHHVTAPAKLRPGGHFYRAQRKKHQPAYRQGRKENKLAPLCGKPFNGASDAGLDQRRRCLKSLPHSHDGRDLY